MNKIIARTAAYAGAAAYLMSAAFQYYRSTRGTGLAVDEFSAGTALMYLGLLVLSLALLSDRRWVWWVNLLASAVIFLQAPFGYWPTVYDARPLEVWDWLEGMWFCGLLLLVAACAVLRLAALGREATDDAHQPHLSPQGQR